MPVDAVIYGGDNTNGLIDETGTATPPHVGDASAGNSIQFDLEMETWFIGPPDPAPDPAQPPCVPGGWPLTIPEIQGGDFASPYEGYIVRTTGVVVGLFAARYPALKRCDAPSSPVALTLWGQAAAYFPSRMGSNSAVHWKRRPLTSYSPLPRRTATPVPFAHNSTS